MAQQSVRLGFIGAGNFTRRRLIPNFNAVSGVELVAVSNSSPESSQRVADEFGFAETIADWHTLVELPGIDAVVIGTQAPLHLEIAVAALEAGKHVFTMNALSMSLAEARVMTAKAKEHPDLKAYVFPGGFYLREDNFVQKLIADGYVGQIVQVQCHWQTPFFGLGSLYEVVERWAGRHTRMFANRAALDTEVPGPGGRPTRPTANTVVAQLEGGGSALYIHNPVANGRTGTRIEIHGTEGTIVAYTRDEYHDGIYGAKAGEGEPKQLAVPAELKAEWDDPLAIPVEADFIAAVREGTAPSPTIPSFEDGTRVMEFAEAWGISNRSGSWVDLPLSN